MNFEHYLPPEPQNGNVEYKLKMSSPTEKRFEHLVTQLKWRQREGNGVAIYEIGVRDNGRVQGIGKKDLQDTILTLEKMAKTLNSIIQIIKEMTLSNGKYIATVLVRNLSYKERNSEIRLAVMGNADAGKSTLLGVLTQGILDNGRGKARLNIFRHLHEIRSGRTSSISHEILGFNAEGQVINQNGIVTAQEMCNLSSKLVTFLDLAGHKKYLKTTMQGLLGYSPNYVMLVMSTTSVTKDMSQEHFAITIALEIPFVIVLTKIDLVPPSETLERLKLFLKQTRYNKIAVVVNNADDLEKKAIDLLQNEIIPIFCVSSVNGSGLNLLLNFLYILSPQNDRVLECLEKEPAEYRIYENFDVPDVGQILCGLLVKGAIYEGTKILIGPKGDGTFQNVVVKSIHRNRIPCYSVKAGQSASVVLTEFVPELRNGWVLVDEGVHAEACWIFAATVSILYHPAAICPGFQTTIQIANIRQTAVVISLTTLSILDQTNDKVSIVFLFKSHPEYIVVGQPIFFSNGRSKGIGRITRVFH